MISDKAIKHDKSTQRSTVPSPLRWIVLCLAFIGFAVISGSILYPTSMVSSHVSRPSTPFSTTNDFPNKQGVIPSNSDLSLIASRNESFKKLPGSSDGLFGLGAQGANIPNPFSGFTRHQLREGNSFVATRTIVPYAPRSPPTRT
jgi:hypothetical protein